MRIEHPAPSALQKTQPALHLQKHSCSKVDLSRRSSFSFKQVDSRCCRVSLGMWWLYMSMFPSMTLSLFAGLLPLLPSRTLSLLHDPCFSRRTEAVAPLGRFEDSSLGDTWSFLWPAEINKKQGSDQAITTQTNPCPRPQMYQSHKHTNLWPMPRMASVSENKTKICKP
jgi:hypothetical protein